MSSAAAEATFPHAVRKAIEAGWTDVRLEWGEYRGEMPGGNCGVRSGIYTPLGTQAREDMARQFLAAMLGGKRDPYIAANEMARIAVYQADLLIRALEE